MRTLHIDVTATTSATPATVYALLRDGATWPQWSPIESFTLESSGSLESSIDEGEDVGAIRVFRTGRIRSRERLVELVPDRRLSYVLVDGLAVRDYRADIDLRQTLSGTDIHWHSGFRAKVPGTGWLYRRQLTTFIRQCVDGLAGHAANAQQHS
jgi:hypothetical protein